MVFDLYFNVSRTAVEILAIALVAGATVYIIKDLAEEEPRPEINPIEG